MRSRRGVLLLVIALVVVGSLLMVGAQRIRGGGTPIGSRHVLTFDVPSTIEEDEAEIDFFAPVSWRRSRLTMYELLETLERARQDPQVRALVLHVESLDWGWAKLAEFRDALLALREAKKPVYVALEGGGEPELFLASAATRIAMPPASELRLNGLTASAMFLRGTFDKVGVKPNFLSVGKYKSAVESYTRTGLSDPAREALAAVLQDTYRTLTDTLATAFDAEPDSIVAWMDRGPFSAEEALELGLVDTLLDRSDLDTLAVRRAGLSALPLRLTRYAERNAGRLRSLDRIALVTATGTITPGKSRTSGGERILGAETLIESLRRARARSAIKAIVLRIDSPGGDAVASDEIWREVVRCRRAKPVIVSMSDVAASGGYYIAAGADTIVAQPATITGSIGIYGGKFNLRGLYEKLGLSIETVSTGPRAEMYSPFRDFTDEEASAFQAQLQKSYERFLDRVATGRHQSVEWADSVGQGRIWSGVAAMDLGLVDVLGGLETAVEIARLRAGFAEDEEVEVERFPERDWGFFERYLRDLWDPDERERSAALGALLEPMQVIERAALLGTGAALAIMPWTIVIR